MKQPLSFFFTYQAKFSVFEREQLVFKGSNLLLHFIYRVLYILCATYQPLLLCWLCYFSFLLHLIHSSVLYSLDPRSQTEMWHLKFSLTLAISKKVGKNRRACCNKIQEILKMLILDPVVEPKCTFFTRICFKKIIVKNTLKKFLKIEQY